MNRPETLAMVMALTGCDDESVLSAYIAGAKSIVLSRAFPFDSTVEEVPTRYHMLVCRIAQDLFNRRGAEGQTAHSENGYSRTWGAESVSKDLLSEIVPHVGTI
jgi:hypothetical protein